MDIGTIHKLAEDLAGAHLDVINGRVARMYEDMVDSFLSSGGKATDEEGGYTIEFSTIEGILSSVLLDTLLYTKMETIVSRLSGERDVNKLIASALIDAILGCCDEGDDDSPSIWSDAIH